MGKRFNINGLCIPDLHYMVNISEKLLEIKSFIEQGEYFVINRARQYGKTTTLNMLERELSDQYMVFSISFEGMTKYTYEDEDTFCKAICGLIYDTIDYGEVTGVPDCVKEECRNMSQADGRKVDFRSLSNFISLLCKEAGRPVILMIDEVDQAGNQEMFLSFLGMLRNKYLKRGTRPTFQSVILAGVYDIKNLKLKIRPSEEHQYNSPWNIAAEFNVDMSFSKQEIAGMLKEYEQEHHTGMDIKTIAEMIYAYTAGYPFLVSYICKKIDEDISGRKEYPDQAAAWTKNGVLEAIKLLIKGPNTLYDDMIKHVIEYPDLYAMLHNILFKGEEYQYHEYDKAVNIGKMFGFIIDNHGTVAVANRIFETQLYSYFNIKELR